MGAHCNDPELFCSKTRVHHIPILNSEPKGQLISKCLFGIFTFFQKTNGNKSTSRQVVKLNLFVHFLEETSA